jgi:apolipoprotein N-acyltransferase
MAGGALWGASVFLFAATHSDTSLALSPLAFVLLTVTPAVYAAMGAWVTRRAGFSPFVLAVGWILAEFALRPLALTHGLGAVSTASSGLLGIVGQFLGHAWVAFLLVYCGAWLLRLVSRMRLALILSQAVAGLDEARRMLWLIPALVPQRVVRSAPTRAPPRNF